MGIALGRGRRGLGDRAVGPSDAVGQLFPVFFGAATALEQAIVAVVMEAYVNGVSTREVDRLVEQLGIEGMTKDRVSAICRGLDDGRWSCYAAGRWRGANPYLRLDAKHVKVVEITGRVVSKALVIAYAVHETGVREVIGLDIGEVESGSFWVEFLRALKKRGLSGVRLAISDQHEGLKHAIARVLACAWQRCTVHFVRDMLAHCRRDQRGLVSAALREVFNAQDATPASARTRARAPSHDRSQGLRAARGRRGRPHRLLPAPAQSTGPSCGPPTRWSASTKRSAAAQTSSGSSPTTPQLIRRAGALLSEQNDEWLLQRRYLSAESMELILYATHEPANSLEQQPDQKETAELNAA